MSQGGLFPTEARTVKKPRKIRAKPKKERKARSILKIKRKTSQKAEKPKIIKKKVKQRPTITAHFLTPSGIVGERQVREHNRFNHKKGTYEVRNVFTSKDGERMMLMSIGNPIPQPSNGATSSTAMEGQYVSATIETLSNPGSPDMGGMFTAIMDKIRIVPPALIVGIIVLAVLISQGFFG